VIGRLPPSESSVPAAHPLDLDALTRESTPLRVSFLHRVEAGGGAGPLASFVRGRRGIALDLLLFAHTVWPLSNPKPISASSSEWVRSISLAEGPGSRSTVSRSWSWLEEMNLVRTERRGRERVIEILREDASGRPWSNPSYEAEPYFRLPLAYWTGGFARDLSLSAKAVLLIGLSLQSRKEDYFELPLERGAGWYGLSPSTIQRGLSELRAIALLRRWSEQRDTEGSPIGITYDQRYALNSLVDVGSQRTYGRGGRIDAGTAGDEIPL
jgi:DNA-binding transcriptional ArsR family regulator